MLKIALFATVAIVSAHHAYAWDCTNPANAGMGECPAAAPTPTPAMHQGQRQSLTASQLNNQSLQSAISNRINTGGNTQSVAGSGNSYVTTKYPAIAAPAYAPSFGTANPCVGGSISGGVSLPIFGVTLGGQKPDMACELRELGETDAARAYLCEQNGDVRTAFYDTNRPCPKDVARWQGEHPQAVVYLPPPVYVPGPGQSGYVPTCEVERAAEHKTSQSVAWIARHCR